MGDRAKYHHISNVELSDVEKEHDDYYVGGNEDLGENALTGDPIGRHHHQSQNFEEADTNISTNQQHNIVDIEAYFASDYEVSAVGGSSIEGTSDTEDVVEPTLWFGKILPLLSFFRKVSLLFIFLFGTYLFFYEIMIRFYGKSLQTHRINNKAVKEVYKCFVMTDSITSYIVNFVPDACMIVKGKNLTD